MGLFVFFLILSLILFVTSQPREVINEVWRDIEEYEEMKRTGFKSFPKESIKDDDLELGWFRLNILLDFLFFVVVVILFGFIGYFLSLAL